MRDQKLPSLTVTSFLRPPLGTLPSIGLAVTVGWVKSFPFPDESLTRPTGSPQVAGGLPDVSTKIVSAMSLYSPLTAETSRARTRPASTEVQDRKSGRS